MNKTDQDLNKGTYTQEEIINYSHQLRNKMLYSIQIGDKQSVSQLKKTIDTIEQGDLLDILGRVKGNRLRSMKNFLLSHNTLYSYRAETGGLSPVQSHYMSEKYAVMIEHTDTLTGLEKIHNNMLNDYVDLPIRFLNNENATIVEKVVYFIEKNFAEEFSIEEIADKFYVHPSHLMRAFKKEKGVTISHFRNQKRTKEAKELLINSHLTLTDIALMVGFANSQYFSKVFKAEVGVTPKVFRKKSVEGE